MDLKELPQNQGLLQMLQGILGSTTAGGQKSTGTSTGQTSQNQAGTTQISSDTTDLHTVLAKQLAGIGTQDIQSIYQQGAKAVPNLVNTQADALGLRATGNTGLGNSTSDLNASILAHIADLNAASTNAASGTAKAISDANKTQTTSNTATGTQSGTTANDTATNSTTAVDTSKLGPILAAMAGVSGVNSVLGGGTAGGGLSDLLKNIPGLSSLFGTAGAGGTLGSLGTSLASLTVPGAAGGLSIGADAGSAMAGLPDLIPGASWAAGVPEAGAMTTYPIAGIGGTGAGVAGVADAAGLLGTTAGATGGAGGAAGMAAGEAAAASMAGETAGAAALTPEIAALMSNPATLPIALAILAMTDPGQAAIKSIGNATVNVADKGAAVVSKAIDPVMNAISSLFGMSSTDTGKWNSPEEEAAYWKAEAERNAMLWEGGQWQGGS